MSGLEEVLLAVAVIGYVVGRQLVGEPLRAKRVVLLPVLLTGIGVLELSGSRSPLRPVDATCLLLGCVIALGIGLGQGRSLRLSSRGGHLWGQLPVRGLWWWLALIASRVALMGAAAALGAHAASSGASILLVLGVNRIGQAAVVVPRALSSRTPFAPEGASSTLLGALGGRRSR